VRVSRSMLAPAFDDAALSYTRISFQRARAMFVVASRYVNEIIADLLKHVTDSQWRVREACCGAIADILRGRRWPELRDHIAPLWSKLFRALDDVKESVRVAAEAALKRCVAVALPLSCVLLRCVSQKVGWAGLGVAVGDALLPCVVGTTTMCFVHSC
jgi:hypothetical protein